MAALPRYERKGAGLIEQIGVVRQPRERGLGDSGAGAAADAVAGVLRRAATSLGDEAESIAVADSTDAGRDAGVQRAADGTPTFRPVDNSTPARRAYNRAGIVSYAAEQQTAARRSAVDLRAQSQEDPDRFEALWTGHTEGVLSGVPQELRTTVQRELATVGGEHRNAMVDDRRRRQFAVATRTITESIETTEGELATEALAGRHDAPRARDLTTRHGAAIDAAVASGILSPEQAQARRDRLSRIVTGHALVPANVRLMRDVDALPGDAFERALGGRESGGRAGIVNPQGFAGRFQFGAARLAELGFYQAATGEDLNANQWRGTFRIPGHEGVRTLTDFLGSADAQRAAFGPHTADIDQQLAPVLATHGGQTIAGVPITRDALRGMAHLGGVAGARRFVETGGTYNPADRNGTRLSDYGRTFAQVAQSDATVGERAAQEMLRREALALGLPPSETLQIERIGEAALRDQAVRIRVDNDGFTRDATATRATILRGQDVPVAQLEALERRAQASGEQRQMDQARELRQDHEALGGFARLSPSQQSEQIAVAQAAYDALPADASPMDRERDSRRLAGMLEVNRAGAAAIQADGFTFGARAHREIVGPVAPLDWANPDEAVLGRRRVQADLIGERVGRRVLPISQDELARLQSAIEVAAPSQQAEIGARVMAGLGPDHGRRVAAALSRRSEDGGVVAAAWAIGVEDRDVARAILAGREALRANSHFAPENNAQFREAVDARLGDALGMAPAESRGHIEAAARAIYASESQRAGDTTGRLDEARLRTALDRVTGGVATWNGGRLIVPRRGMTETQFGDLMAGLTDADLIGDAYLSAAPRAADGSAVTIDMIRRHGRLYSAGDGRYAVRVGSHDVLAPNGGRYVLDLRAIPIRERTPAHAPGQGEPASMIREENMLRRQREEADRADFPRRGEASRAADRDRASRAQQWLRTNDPETYRRIPSMSAGELAETISGAIERMGPERR